MISVVLLGEKDHGKSTLLGRFLYETKSMPEDRIREIKAAVEKSGKVFEWAHLLDSFRYEREKEMTLDTTRVILKIGKKLYHFIDVPGHEELIKNMVSGAWEAKYAILMVAADAGITKQTKKHLEIAGFLGIRDIFTVINKLDKISRPLPRFTELKREIGNVLKNAGLKEKTILPLIARSGDNMVKKSRKLCWFKGPTLLKLLKTKFKPTPRRMTKEEFRMPIQDIYDGSIIIGKIKSGRIKTGDQIRLFPYRTAHRVAGIFFNNQKARDAKAGDNVGITLSPASQKVKRGDLLSKGSAPILSDFIKGSCLFFKKPRGILLLEYGFASVRVIKMMAADIAPGRIVKVLIKLNKKIPAPDRFVLKEKGAIVAIGKEYAYQQ